VKRACARIPKEGMALFLKEIEEALASIINPVFNIREMKLFSFMFFADFLKGNIGKEEPTDHFQYLSIPYAKIFSLHAVLLFNPL